MEVFYTVYLMQDSHGNTAYAVADDSSNGIYVCGLRDINNNPIYFESEAYHLDSFCKENKIELKKIDFKDTFQEMWNKN